MIKKKLNRRGSSILEEDIIKNNRYTVRFARDREEVTRALKLRFQVFNLELGEGLTESYLSEMDLDKYDQQCHHLIVIENSTGNVIGTYRMQTTEEALKGEGFYTSEEFELSQFPESVLNDAVELGRACIAKEHRSGRVLYLLWRGMAAYVQVMKKRYLFGCCSITSQDPCLGFAIQNYLIKQNYYHPDYFVDTKKEYKCVAANDKKMDDNDIELPQLFKLYLELGTLVCSPPALDSNFKTIDFLILLDVKNLNEKSKALFF
ncbi:MAG: GNAT family N-acetyltransferase [Balneolaceae bacterium]